MWPSHLSLCSNSVGHARPYLMCAHDTRAHAKASMHTQTHTHACACVLTSGVHMACTTRCVLHAMSTLCVVHTLRCPCLRAARTQPCAAPAAWPHTQTLKANLAKLLALDNDIIRCATAQLDVHATAPLRSSACTQQPRCAAQRARNSPAVRLALLVCPGLERCSSHGLLVRLAASRLHAQQQHEAAAPVGRLPWARAQQQLSTAPLRSWLLVPFVHMCESACMMPHS